MDCSLCISSDMVPALRQTQRKLVTQTPLDLVLRLLDGSVIRCVILGAVQRQNQELFQNLVDGCVVQIALVIPLQDEGSTIAIYFIAQVPADLFSDWILSCHWQELIPRAQILHVTQIELTSQTHVVFRPVHPPDNPRCLPLDPSKIPSAILHQLLPHLCHHLPQSTP